MQASSEPALTPQNTGNVRKWAPYFHVLCAALLVTASEILLKKGANAGVQQGAVTDWLGCSSLLSHWVWLAIICYIGSFAFWLHALRLLPLSIAFNLANIEHVLVPLGAWFFLGEKIGALRWMGIFLVLAGIWIIARPLTRMEEKL